MYSRPNVLASLVLEPARQRSPSRVIFVFAFLWPRLSAHEIIANFTLICYDNICVVGQGCVLWIYEVRMAVDKQIFAARLAQLMAEHNMTVNDLVNELGIEKPCVRQWLAGRRAPKWDSLMNMAELFGVSLLELLGRDNQSRSQDDPE